MHMHNFTRFGVVVDDLNLIYFIVLYKIYYILFLNLFSNRKNAYGILNVSKLKITTRDEK